MLSDNLQLRDLNRVCKEKKKMLTLKSVFLVEIQEPTWDAATQKYPQYTSPDTLKQFLALPYIRDKKTGVHPALQLFCSKVVKSRIEQRSTPKITILPKGDATIAVAALDPNELAYEDLTTAAPNFTGFYVTMANVCSDTDEELQIKVLRSCSVPEPEENEWNPMHDCL